MNMNNNNDVSMLSIVWFFSFISYLQLISGRDDRAVRQPARAVAAPPEAVLQLEPSGPRAPDPPRRGQPQEAQVPAPPSRGRAVLRSQEPEVRCHNCLIKLTSSQNPLEFPSSIAQTRKLFSINFCVLFVS